MKTEMTIAELKEIIAYYPDDAVVRISNGHSIWGVKTYDYQANPHTGETISIVLENDDMPK